MVHHCLQIPEIVAHLCETVYFARDGGFDHHRTLATMAKVCSTFRFWAEKLIWTDMHSLLPLIMSLPTDLWSIHGEELGDPILVLTRQPTAQEIEEFVSRSQRISRLTLPKRTIPWKGEAAHMAEFLRVVPEAYTMLHLAALAAGHVLFPNLVSITVLDPCPELEPLYDHFGPNLAEIDIDLNLHLRGNSICKLFLDRLRCHNQGIRSVKIELAPPDVLGDIICASPRLERLVTQSLLTTESLRHLGNLDTLESLTFKLDSFHPPSKWFSPFTFEFIKSLTCQCEDMDDAILLLSKLSHCHLAHLEIEVTYHDKLSTWSDPANDHNLPPASAQEQGVRHQKWMKLARAVSHSLNRSSLTSLRIKEHQSSTWHYDALPLGFDSIGPLVALKNLGELEIDAAGGISVNERDYRILARCMSSFKRIDIKPPIVVPSPTDQDNHHYHWW